MNENNIYNINVDAFEEINSDMIYTLLQFISDVIQKNRMNRVDRHIFDDDFIENTADTTNENYIMMNPKPISKTTLRKITSNYNISLNGMSYISDIIYTELYTIIQLSNKIKSGKIIQCKDIIDAINQLYNKIIIV